MVCERIQLLSGRGFERWCVMGSFAFGAVGEWTKLHLLPARRWYPEQAALKVVEGGGGLRMFKKLG